MEPQQLLEAQRVQAHNDATVDIKGKCAKNIRSNTQSKLRKMQRSWLGNNFDEIQGFAVRIGLKNLHDSLRESAALSFRAPLPCFEQMDQH
ncbi:hypothetical protein PoB_005877500 [Plakobranchus ocellatus]|uniref:Uncharacterized protein n=1 Tax=Plakobranchus ocellatus TaxID=259542 RepID=A0AAV4CK95_9GAST|nr:hypothetical protein PoB_005877500 [Plakobranchus ocellatus]